MPTYQIQYPTNPGNPWANGVSALAGALAGNPEIEMQGALMATEADRNRSMAEVQRASIPRDDMIAEADTTRLRAQAALYAQQGDLASAQALLAQAETADQQAMTAGRSALAESFMGENYDPRASFAGVALAGENPSDFNAGAVLPALSPDGMDQDWLDQINAGNGMAWGDTAQGFGQGLEAEADMNDDTLANLFAMNEADNEASMSRQRAEPLVLGEGDTAFNLPGMPFGASVAGMNTLGGDEAVFDGAGRAVAVGPQWGQPDPADAPDIEDIKNYRFVDPETGQERQTLVVRDPEDGMIYDVQTGELMPGGGTIFDADVQATNAGDVGGSIETAGDVRIADFGGQITRAVEGMNSLVGYDPETDSFSPEATFPGPRAHVGNVVENTFGTYAGKLVKGDFENEYDYRMFAYSEPLLRLRSGAATPEEEVRRYKQYAPQPGDPRPLQELKIREMNATARALEAVARGRNIPVEEIMAAAAGDTAEGDQYRAEVAAVLSQEMEGQMGMPEAAPTVTGATAGMPGGSAPAQRPDALPALPPGFERD